jgi:hypothetical protein
MKSKKDKGNLGCKKQNTRNKRSIDVNMDVKGKLYMKMNRIEKKEWAIKLIK